MKKHNTDKRFETLIWALVIASALLGVVSYGGPIKGLVDIGTGQEVPDADARYAVIGGTNSTAWFTNLYVEVSASNGTQVVNWQTMTNHTISNFYTQTELSSTNAGSEGITLIGALGGYTLARFFEDTALRGQSRDSVVWSIPIHTTNLVTTWGGGDVYDPASGYYHILPGTNTLVDNALNWAYWSTNSPNTVQWTTGTRPCVDDNVVLARFSVATGISYGQVEVSVGDLVLRMDEGHSQVMPSLVAEGIVAYASGTGLSNIILTVGVEYQDMELELAHNAQNLADTNITDYLHIFHHTNSSTYGSTVTNLFPGPGLWDR